MSLFFILTGIVCIIYCLSIRIFGGYGTLFYLIWGLMGTVFLIWGILRKHIIPELPKWLVNAGRGFIILGVVIFIIVEGLILSYFHAKGKEGLDYLIVLGAQLKPSGPSFVLKKRLDTAYDYLCENPDTIVIVSGGQGSNEPMSEAEGMYRYLVEKGIDPGRIIKEDRSTDTNQNIKYSMELFDYENASVGIVTNNFHVFRGVHLAKAAGCKEVYGLAAPAYSMHLPNNMLREFLGIVVDFLEGNLT